MEREEIVKVLNETYFSDECHEKSVVTNLHRLLRGAHVFVDVGASLGQYTFFANAAMTNGTIVAIEADPIRFETLRDNCTLWGDGSTNQVRAIHAAAADCDGEIEFCVTDSNVSGGLFPHPVPDAAVRWRGVKVPCVTLDGLFPKDPPDLVKVDVEGGEFRVLQGARRLLAGGRPKFLVEVHDWPDPIERAGASEIVALMASFGYRSEDFHGRALFVSPRSGWWWRALFRAGLRRAMRIARVVVTRRDSTASGFVNLLPWWHARVRPGSRR